MRNITLGKSKITAPQNGFGALPVQRISHTDAVRLLRRAFEGGMRFFDTARVYTDSEEKIGDAFEGIRGEVVIASKTMSKTPEGFLEDLDCSLKKLRTDHIDLYQLHNVSQCYRPGDGTGMYECLTEAKKQGKILHFGVSTHKLMVAEEIIESGLYDTLQYPFSYLATDRELALPVNCKKHDMGMIAMKGLSGGLLTNSRICMAFMSQFENVMPIWGIQKEKELEEWLSYMDRTPEMTEEIRACIEKDKKELGGDFCRGCGYCLPCPVGIQINDMARMSLMIRRSPSAVWLSPPKQAEMKKVENCLECRQCAARCPYELDTPALLKKNYEDYMKVLAGERTV